MADPAPSLPHSLFRAALEQSTDAALLARGEVGQEPRILFVNRAFCEHTQRSPEEALGLTFHILRGPDTPTGQWDKFRSCFSSGQPFSGEMVTYRKDGTHFVGDWQLIALSSDEGSGTYFLWTCRDGTLRRAHAERLQQLDKAKSMRKLASGIAHEINGPIQFVNDSVTFVRDSIPPIAELFIQYRKALLLASPEKEAWVKDAEEAADLEYRLANIPAALSQSVEGLGRVAQIVRAVKEMTFPDRPERVAADLNGLVQNAVTVATNEYKYVARVQLELAELPPILCHPTQIGQAALSLLLNAAQAMAEERASGKTNKGMIRIRTFDRGEIGFSVSDAGPGALADEAKQRLALCESVALGHGGRLSLETHPELGYTATLLLPSRLRLLPASN
jgi:PAS domain S-box-containing protein